MINQCYRLSGCREQTWGDINRRRLDANLWYCSVVRTTEILVTGKSLLLCTVWTAAVRLWQDYITREWVERGKNGGFCLIALHHSFSLPNLLTTVLFFWLILIFYPFHLLSLRSLLLSSFSFRDPKAFLFSLSCNSLFPNLPSGHWGVNSRTRRRLGNNKNKQVTVWTRVMSRF